MRDIDALASYCRSVVRQAARARRHRRPRVLRQEHLGDCARRRTRPDRWRIGSRQLLYARWAGLRSHLRWQEFVDAVAQLREVATMRYHPYDWDADALSPAEVIDAPMVIVEGLYAMHRDVCALYDARIWIEADLATRWDRVLARDGPSRIDRWRNEWVPMEQRYVDEQRPWRQADVLMAGPGLELHQLGHALS